MKNLVLLVDDDKLPMQYYVKALEQNNIEVKHCVEPDSALAFVKEKGSQIKIVVLDIMMSPGKAYKNEDTHEGLRTGVFLLKKIREELPNTPIIVLTNVKNQETLDEFQEGSLLKVRQKMDCSAFELVDLVNELIANHN